MFKKASLVAASVLMSALPAPCQTSTSSIPMSSVTGLNDTISQINTSIANLQAAINGLNAVAKVTGEAVSGTVNGINASFQLKYVPFSSQGITVYRNGIRQTAGNDYTFSGTTVTFVSGAIPQTGDTVTADYVTSPQAIPNAATLAFGNQAEYSSAPTQTLTFSNPGPAPANFSSWTITGANASSYSISANTCGLSLPAGSACTINISFNPVQVGALSATLIANDNAAGSPQTVSLTGTGILAMPSGWTTLVSAVNGTCIDTVGQSNSSATTLNTCNGGTSQAFQFTTVSGGYEVTQESSSLQLDVNGGPNNYADNSSLGLWSYWGGTNEIFNTQTTADGYFIVTVSNSGKCLTANGTSVVSSTCVGANTQKWSLIPVSH